MSSTVRRKRKSQKGGSISSILSKLKSAAVGIHNFAKKNQLVSKGARALGYDSFANKAAQLGYGRPRKRRVRK
jgi:hypothetical protein